MVETACSAPGILVVDDDALVLGMLKLVFARKGFRVWASHSGQAALDVYRDHGADIDVVLLDVCMPGLDGPATLARLLAIDPGVRSCFMSGFTGHYTTDELRDLGAAEVYEKPFSIVPLADELWQLARP